MEMFRHNDVADYIEKRAPADLFENREKEIA